MKELVITQIQANRKRNFDVYPVKDEVVEGLMESYRRSGDFGLIPVRPLDNGKYEQACGHHRLEAMKRLGFLKVAVKVAHFSDDEMTRIMIDENATQYGANPAACADSVLAMATDIAYAMFLSDDLENLAEISASFVGSIPSQASFGQIKNKLLKGDISGDVICVALGGKWMPNGHATKGDSPLGPDAISSALQGLKADDHLAKKIFAEQKRANIGLAAKRAAEKKREEEAERKREQLRLAEEQARKLAILKAEEDHRKKIEASRKKKADAEAKKKAVEEAKKQLAEIQRLRKEADAAEARVEADRQKRAAAARKKERERLEKIEYEKRLREEARQKAEDNRYLAGGTQAMFENNAQFDMFRSIVKKNSQYFPIPEQHELIETMLETLGKAENGADVRHKVSAAAIKKYLNHEVAERNKELRELLKKEEAAAQARKEAMAISNKAKRIHDELDTAFRRLEACLNELHQNTENAEFMAAFIACPNTRYLYASMNAMEEVLPSVRQVLGVASRSIVEEATIENVIDTQ